MHPQPRDDSNPDTTQPLADVLAKHAIELPPDQTAQLEEYCRLLWQWNQKLNLTRHTDCAKFVARDLFDCLQLSKLLGDSEQVLDVGSGGGVPGVVLAILRPDLRISLCESVGKKAKALISIVESLDLPSPVYPCRGEQLLVDFCFQTIVMRAVGPLWKTLTWFKPHWPCIGQLLVVKGPRWVEERGEARHRGLLRQLELRRAASYFTPETTAENVILKIWPKDRPEM